MALLNLSNAYLGFGDHPLLDHTELHIEPGERVWLDATGRVSPR